MEKQVFRENELRVHRMLLIVSWGGVLFGVTMLLAIMALRMSDRLTFSQIGSAAAAGCLFFGIPTVLYRRGRLSGAMKHILMAASVLFVTVLAYALPQMHESFAFYYYVIIVSALYLDTGLALFSAALSVAGDACLMVLLPELIPRVNTFGVLSARFLAFSLAAAGVYCFVLLARRLIKRVADQQVHMTLMNQHLRSLISQNLETSSNLAASGQELLANSEETSAAIEEIASTAQHLAQGATLTGQWSREAAQTISEYAGAAEQVAVSCGHSSRTSDEMLHAAELGNQAALAVIDMMNRIEAALANTNQVVRELAGQSEEIEKLNTNLNGIIRQTNLLSLNATIEASRADVQGKGFAVVAKEIGALAENSREVIGLVAGLLNEVKQKTEAAASAIVENARTANRGAELGRGLTQTFQSMLAKASDTRSDLTAVNAAIQSQFDSIQRIQERVLQLAQIAEAGAAGAQAVAGVTEETAAAVEHVTRSAAELTRLAEKLQESIPPDDVLDSWRPDSDALRRNP